MDSSITAEATSALFEAVSEFLSFHDCPEALKALQDGRTRQHALRVSNVQLAGKARATIISDLMRRFDTGATDDFFAIWHRFVPAQRRQLDELTQQLEFGLRVHFVVWPLLDTADPDASRDVQRRQRAFQDYLSSHGALLAQQPSLASYYALPFVPPETLREHPAFAHLFDPACTPAQRAQLEAYLQTVPASLNVPRLYTLWHGAAAGGGASAPPPPAADVQRLLQGTCGLDALLPDATPLPLPLTSEALSPAAAAQHAWDDATHQLCGIPETSQESTDARAASPAASPPSPNSRRSASRTPTPPLAADSGASVHFDEAADLSRAASSSHHSPQPAVSPTTSERQGVSSARRPASSGGGSAHVTARRAAAGAPAHQDQDAFGLGGSVTRSLVQQALLPVLDWRAVQRAVLSRPPADAARLLQAIRWWLVRSPAGLERRKVLADLLSHDVLALGGAEPPVTTALLAQSDPAVTSELVRLVSALASDSHGRAYLLRRGSPVLAELFEVLVATPQAKVNKRHGDAVRDAPLHQHALAALQKLSLRRAAQAALVAAGALPWLVDFLSAPDTLSEHSLEYSMAMLMNLCLRRAGRRACTDLPVLDVLDALIQVPNTQVRTYVHGALYALVAEPSILEAAQRRGLADVLAAVAAASAPLFQRHIAHILARLEEAADGAGARGGGADESDGDEGDDADDVDAMHYDDEYEEMEAAMTSDAVVGEELLCSEFLAQSEPRRGAPARGKTPPVATESRPALPAHALSRSGGGPQDDAPLAKYRAAPPGDAALTRPVTPRPGSSRGRLAPVATSRERSLTKRSASGRSQGDGGQRGASGGGHALRSESVTMRDKAQAAARKVATGNSDEYVQAFGARRELPRTPRHPEQ